MTTARRLRDLHSLHLIGLVREDERFAGYISE